MVRLFLEKFFPSSRAIKIKKEITGVKQRGSETLYDYWERFKSLCASFPQHNMSETTLIEHFYNGLLEIERKMMDAASGGALFTKSPEEARQLIDTMACTSRQYENQDTSRRVNEVRSPSLESQISQLTSLVKSLVAGNSQQVRVCGICAQPTHATDACPTLQEDDLQHVNAMGGFPGPPQRIYDPYSNTYNPGWRDHPNFSYGQRQQNLQQAQPRPPQQPSSSQQGMSLEDIVKSLANNTLQFQQETKASIQSLEKQMSQLATSVGRLESQGKLPSQTEANPKQNVSAMTLRSGKELLESGREISRGHGKTAGSETEAAVKIQKTGCEVSRGHGKMAGSETEAEVTVPEQTVDQNTEQKSDPPAPIEIRPPFPERFSKTKKEKEEKEILDVFRKVEVNIPLLDAIKKMPRYAKFLKELCTNKKKISGYERISVGENVSAVLQRKLPPKCKDRGMFSISCTVGNLGIERAMCDLGASINVMPLSIYSSLNAGPLKETGVVIQLADRSIVYPEGVLENVLVQVNGLIFPADFFVLDMDEDNSSKSSEILLGRPFLSTARTKIDVYDGTLTMEFDGEMVKFNVYDSTKYPSDASSVCGVDVIDHSTQQTFELNHEDELMGALCENITCDGLNNPLHDIVISDKLQEVVHELDALKPVSSNTFISDLTSNRAKLLPSVVQAPKMEMKALPNHQKLDIQELKEIRQNAYEDSTIYKEKTKAFHGSMLSRKQLSIGQHVLLFHSRLKLFPAKLKSRWIGPFIVTNIYSNGAVEIRSLETNKIFKVNGQRLKPFCDNLPELSGEENVQLAKVLNKD